MAEEIVTDIPDYYKRLIVAGQSSQITGHWHWETGSRIRPVINLHPPMPGRFTWNCMCAAEITHKTTQEGSHFKPGDRLRPAHRSW
jgi:hypothetical protein